MAELTSQSRIPYFECSAKTGDGVEELFKGVANALLKPNSPSVPVVHTPPKKSKTKFKGKHTVGDISSKELQLLKPLLHSENPCFAFGAAMTMLELTKRSPTNRAILCRKENSIQSIWKSLFKYESPKVVITALKSLHALATPHHREFFCFPNVCTFLQKCLSSGPDVVIRAMEVILRVKSFIPEYLSECVQQFDRLIDLVLSLEQSHDIKIILEFLLKILTDSADLTGVKVKNYWGSLLHLSENSNHTTGVAIAKLLHAMARYEAEAVSDFFMEGGIDAMFCSIKDWIAAHCTNPNSEYQYDLTRCKVHWVMTMVSFLQFIDAKDFMDKHRENLEFLCMLLAQPNLRVAIYEVWTGALLSLQGILVDYFRNFIHFSPLLLRSASPKDFPPKSAWIPIGKGSFGEVYSTCLVESGENVAIKIIDGADDCDPQTLRRELSLAASLLPDHKNILKFYGYYLESNGFHLVSQLADYSLLELLSLVKFTTEHIKVLAFGIARGLQLLHSLQIVHRDLKVKFRF